jgi:hypothetical protein
MMRASGVEEPPLDYEVYPLSKEQLFLLSKIAL